MRLLALQDDARDERARFATRELAAALRALGHEVFVAEIAALPPEDLDALTAALAPDATLTFNPAPTSRADVPRRVQCLLGHPVSTLAQGGDPRAVTLTAASPAQMGWHRGASRGAPVFGAPASLAEEHPASDPRPFRVLLRAEGTTPTAQLCALRERLPRDLAARAMDFCDHWLAAVEASGDFAPEPLEAAFARFFVLGLRDELGARALLRGVFPMLAGWWASLVRDRVLDALVAARVPTVLVGDGPWSPTVRAARHIHRIPAAPFADLRALYGSARVVLDPSPQGAALLDAASAVMAGARLCAPPTAALGAGEEFGQWFQWRDLDRFGAVLERALGDDDARHRGQRLAQERLTWEPLARAVLRAATSDAPAGIAIAA